MATSSTKRYPTGPRQRLLLYGFGGLILVPAVLLLVIGGLSGKSDAIEAGIILVVILTPFAAMMAFFGAWPHLTISSEGVVIRGVMGFSTQTFPWSNVERIIWKPGKQAFLMREPLTSRGAVKFRNWANTTFRGIPMYDDEQRAYILQQRYVPIVAFAYWIKHGDLLDRITSIAPHVAESLHNQEGEYEKARKATVRTWLVIGGVSAALSGIAVIAGITGWEPPENLDAFIQYGAGILVWVVAAFLVVYSVLNVRSAWNYARQRQFGFAAFWIVMAVVQAAMVALIIGTSLS